VVGFNYDGLGRLLDDGLRSYVWDGASFPDTIDDGSETRDVDPDGLGRIKVAMPSLDSSTPYVQFVHAPLSGVVNPVPSVGGAEAEDATPAETRVSERLRHRDRAVSLSDFEGLALPSPDVKVTRASATPNGPGVDRAHWITTPGGLLLHSIDLTGGSPNRRYFHFDERGNTAFQTNDAGNMVNVYAYSVQGEVSRIGESQQYPRFTYGGALGLVQESEDGLYRWGSSFYDANAPDGQQNDSRFSLVVEELGENGDAALARDGVSLSLGTGPPREWAYIDMALPSAMKVRPLQDRVIVSPEGRGNAAQSANPIQPQIHQAEPARTLWPPRWLFEITGRQMPGLGLGYPSPVVDVSFIPAGARKLVYAAPPRGSSAGTPIGYWLGMRLPTIVPLPSSILDDRHFRLCVQGGSDEAADIIKAMMENHNAVIEAVLKMMNNRRQNNQRVNALYTSS
jgi:hypothetical protein